ncbi:L-serine ammonia-lyase, iron-sulfur-dependent, subunit alpha [Mollicutes bacterium LVI A0039]|nr:L-serine ammonia-lyase, iron-sulfur-dependent, subunit alpha [Mollicutes bacterium LVI A0039]
MEQQIISDLINIINEEIEIAQGCTEPIAGAYTASVATRILNMDVERIEVVASTNIIKNAKGVVIPGTKDLMGIEASVILGMLVGDASLKMEVLSNIDEAAITKTKELLDLGIVSLKAATSPAKLLMSVRMINGEEYAEATIMHMHTNIVKIEKNGIILKNDPCDERDFNAALTSKEHLTLENIHEFASTVDLTLLPILQKQIEFNSAISNEGLTNKWGAMVGKINKKQTLCEGLTFDIRRHSCAAAAAGSDARMSGCSLPVVTVNGSGNQGMTIAIPIIEFAKEHENTEEELYRAVLFGDLISIRLKQSVGRLSPLCGVTYAAIGSVAGILYLQGYELSIVEMMIKNSIANNTGIICDGAKASCALKIYSGLDTALLSAQLAMNGSVIPDGTGIIQTDIEQTINDLKLISDAMTMVDSAVMKILSPE